MATKTLAIKYRPKTWNDVTEQTSTVLILSQQLESGEIKNAYLFTGPAGTGKTTSARIFANEINKGRGNPIELDAASNNGVDDVRSIIQQSKTKSLDSEYKIFIIDECHALSNNAWQAMLKIIEEPPAKSIFIFATTDPQKIPKTILSRVQRYDFQRISQEGIVNRLHDILVSEQKEDFYNSGKASDITYKGEALEYIAKIADGGMRDAISLMDKCLAYSTDLTLENVIKALGTIDYDTMFNITEFVLNKNSQDIMEQLEQLHASGKDLKQFLKQYIQFILDILKYGLGCDWMYISIPKLNAYKDTMNNLSDDQYVILEKLLSVLVNLNTNIKYSSTPKTDMQAEFLLFVLEDKKC